MGLKRLAAWAIAIAVIGLAWGAGTEGQDVLRAMPEGLSGLQLSRQGEAGSQTCRASQYPDCQVRELWRAIPPVLLQADNLKASRKVGGLDAPPASPAEIPTPLAVQDMPEPAANSATSVREPQTAPSEHRPLSGSIETAFLAGYRDGGGDPAWEDRVLSMVECESGWHLNPTGPHLGLAQFAPGTWETVAGISGLWDYTNPYHVGYNVAVWMGMIAPNYGSSQGWPNCW